MNIRTLLQTKLINILNIHTNPDFKFLAECTEWVHQKLVSQNDNLTNLFSFSFLLTIIRIRRIQDRWVLISQKVPKEVELSITNTKSTKTVIEMTAIQTNPNFKQIAESMDFVIRQLVRLKNMTNSTTTTDVFGFIFTHSLVFLHLFALFNLMYIIFSLLLLFISMWID